MIYKESFQNKLFTILLMTSTFCLAKKRCANESIINLELSLLVQWLRSSKLSLNETKTEQIIFTSPCKHLPREPDIRINNLSSTLALGS